MTATPTAPVTPRKSPSGELMPHGPHVRSLVDVLRLLIGGLLPLGGIATANLVDNALLGLSDDGAAAIENLPD